jgi:hypothetical protein
LPEEATETVIATYSPGKAVPILLVLLLPGAILVWGWFSAITEPAHFFHFGSYRTFALIAGSTLFIPFLPRIMRICRQMLFRRWAAVWVTNESLIYLDPTFFKISRANVTTIDSELFGPYMQEGIAIVQKDGRKRVLPVGALSEDGDLIIERLRKACFR